MRGWALLTSYMYVYVRNLNISLASSHLLVWQARQIDQQRVMCVVGVELMMKLGGPPFILGLCGWKIPPHCCLPFPCGRAVIISRRTCVLVLLRRIRLQWSQSHHFLSGRNFWPL